MSAPRTSAVVSVYRKLRRLGVDANVLKDAGSLAPSVDVLCSGFQAIKRLSAANIKLNQYGMSHTTSITYMRFKEQVTDECMANLTGTAEPQPESAQVCTITAPYNPTPPKGGIELASHS
ncbi:hypothetical protein DIPPA_22097 [Diplonema papillatum]|nr:hypothetical protein DIPPA_22097 [Diplonema papillatum]